MFKRLLPTALTGYVLLVIVNWSCTKLDTTTLGSDLIPAVDNVYTFADTLDIISTQGIFDDTFKISRSETNIVMGYFSKSVLLLNWVGFTKMLQMVIPVCRLEVLTREI